MKRGESTISFVEKLLRENLDIPPATELHIVTTQRALAPKPASTETRSRVIKFHHYEQKRIFYTKHGLKKDIILIITIWQPFWINDKNTMMWSGRRGRRKSTSKHCTHPGSGILRGGNTSQEATNGFPVKVLLHPVDPMEQLTQQALSIGEEEETRYPRVAAIRDKLQIYRRKSPQ